MGLFDDWAHTVQILKMCEAFGENSDTFKTEVTLIVPKRKYKAYHNTLVTSDTDTNPFEHFHLKENFNIKELPFIDLFSGTKSKFFYWVRFLSFLISARIYLFFHGYDVLYTREVYFAPFFSRVYLERHSFSPYFEMEAKTKIRKWIKDFHINIFKQAYGIVVLTSFIKNKIVALGVEAEKIHVAPDAVRLEDFDNILSTKDAREKLKLNFSKDDKDVFVMGYVGTLKTMNKEKGVSTAIESLKYLPNKFILYVVGGEPQDIEFYKNFAIEKKVESRVIFAGKVPHAEVPVYTAVCDVLVAPFPDIEHYRYFMSPLKIFEYMASLRPMVVTDLPSLREVLRDRETALFVPLQGPLSAPEGLGKAVAELEANQVLYKHLVEEAHREVVEKYTWKKRASRILDFITQSFSH